MLTPPSDASPHRLTGRRLQTQKQVKLCKTSYANDVQSPHHTVEFEMSRDGAYEHQVPHTCNMSS
eukprot:1512612-Pyramimonas_sp.AAC.1